LVLIRKKIRMITTKKKIVSKKIEKDIIDKACSWLLNNQLARELTIAEAIVIINLSNPISSFRRSLVFIGVVYLG
jgi:hypothetical protein